MSTSLSSILMSPPRRSIAASSTTVVSAPLSLPAGHHKDEQRDDSLNVSSHVPAFAHSSPFLRTARLRDVSAAQQTTHGAASLAVDAIIPDTMQLTSPARWSGVSVDGASASRVHTTEGGTARTRTAEVTSALSTTTTLGMTSNYMKEYDYSQPTVSLKLSAHTSSDKRDHNTAPMAHLSAAPSPHQPVVLHQRAYSGQVQRAREQALVVAATSQGSPRELLYKGLPYTWRELVPFSCPVTHPELMSYDPSGYHSAVAKQTRDIGMRMIDLEAGRRHRSLEGLDLNAERGVTGLSLDKHVKAYRMTQVGTYPGITYGLAS